MSLGARFRSVPTTLFPRGPRCNENSFLLFKLWFGSDIKAGMISFERSLPLWLNDVSNRFGNVSLICLVVYRAIFLLTFDGHSLHDSKPPTVLLGYSSCPRDSNLEEGERGRTVTPYFKAMVNTDYYSFEIRRSRHSSFPFSKIRVKRVGRSTPREL